MTVKVKPVHFTISFHWYYVTHLKFYSKARRLQWWFIVCSSSPSLTGTKGVREKLDYHGINSDSLN